MKAIKTFEEFNWKNTIICIINGVVVSDNDSRKTFKDFENVEDVIPITVKNNIKDAYDFCVDFVKQHGGTGEIEYVDKKEKQEEISVGDEIIVSHSSTHLLNITFNDGKYVYFFISEIIEK